MNNITKDQRSKNMKAIRNKDTAIEIILRKALWKKGIRYRKNYSKLPGKPDIVLTKYKIAIFCDSEFWHGFDWENRKWNIKSNQEYWFPKIESNIKRDNEISSKLEEMEWTVFRFWGNDIKKDIDKIILIILNKISEKS